MIIRKTFVPTEQGNFKVDTISHEGSIWLVPEWIENLDEGTAKPKRMILLDLLPHLELTDGEVDFAIKHQVPKGILDGENLSSPDMRFEIHDLPDVEFRREELWPH